MRTITRLLSARARSRAAFELPPIENEYSIFFLISLELNIGSLWLTREFLAEREYENGIMRKVLFSKKKEGIENLSNLYNWQVRDRILRIHVRSRQGSYYN